MPSRAYIVGPFGSGTRQATALPYGAQHLAAHGYDVTYVDPSASTLHRWTITRRALGLVHRLLGGQRLDPVLEPRRLRDADLLVCFLEDNIQLLAPVVRLLRRGRRRASSVLVVVWLTGSLSDMTPRTRRRWQRRLTAFGTVIVLSSNQVDLLRDALDLPDGLVQFVPFGVEPLTSTGTANGDLVLSVGNDAGRDFDTLVAALRDSAVNTTVLTNATHRARLLDTGRVVIAGPVSRADYLALLDNAGIIVSPTVELPYPGGQTVLLEAMQSGKACVVTSSDALVDYVMDGRDVLFVPAGDAAALRTGVERLRDDAVLRRELGGAAARTAARFTEAAMWAALADLVRP